MASMEVRTHTRLTCQSILDFSQDLDLVLLDNIVAAMYTGAGADQRMAQQVLALSLIHI